MFGQILSVKHRRNFGCKVLVPIPFPYRTNMDPQRREGYMVGVNQLALLTT